MSCIPPSSMHPNEVDAVVRTHEIVLRDLRPIVVHIDQEGHYPQDVLRKLGEAGVFAQHHDKHGISNDVDLGLAIRLMACVSEECLSTAFCVWCHDTFGWYLQNTENLSLRTRLQGLVANGKLLGGTGFSNPIKALSGIEELRLQGRRVAGGYVVDGALPWVSNLQDGHRFAVVFSVENEDCWIAAAVELGSHGVSGKAAAHFLALEGTATLAITFSNAFIPDDDLLTDNFQSFVRKIRAGFILLQTGMAIGLIRNCISLMCALPEKTRVNNTYLSFGPEEAQERLSVLEEEICHLASDPFDPDISYKNRVMTARLEASELSLASTQALMLHAGARAYLSHSVYARRLRESYFVSIVTPAIKHLRRDLALMG